jgi:hypothetical protein
MFDPEQYSNHPYHSRHIDSTTQPTFFPYIYPSYRPELNVKSELSDNYLCKWIDQDTNRMCNRTFSQMQDIGKNKTNIFIENLVCFFFSSDSSDCRACRRR